MELLTDDLLAGDIIYYGESSLVLLPPKPGFLNTLSILMALMPQNI